MKKKILVILLVIFILIMAAAGILIYKNKSNIEALLMSQKMSDEEIKSRITETEKTVDSILEEYVDVLPRDLTEEERAKIDSGEASLYEVVGEIFKEEQQAKKSESEKDKSEEIDRVIAEYIAKMYELEAQYTSQIDGIVATAKAEYIAAAKGKPKDERSAIKISVGSKYVGQLTSMESQADGQVSTVISDLKSYLKSHGRSTDIADEMYNTYLSKKSSVKAYYLSKL